MIYFCDAERIGTLKQQRLKLKKQTLMGEYRLLTGNLFKVFFIYERPSSIILYL